WHPVEIKWHVASVIFVRFSDQPRWHRKGDVRTVEACMQQTDYLRRQHANHLGRVGKKNRRATLASECHNIDSKTMGARRGKWEHACNDSRSENRGYLIDALVNCKRSRP